MSPVVVGLLLVGALRSFSRFGSGTAEVVTKELPFALSLICTFWGFWKVGNGIIHKLFGVTVSNHNTCNIQFLRL